MFPSTLLFSLCALTVANAQAVTNDWSVPCHTGSCSYDIPSTGTGSGSVHISGSSTAISDITTASGWSIIDCDPTALSQSIRLVCHNATAGCDHVESGAGAAGKLVRLPEDCGAGPFARVASMGIASDQSVPSTIAARFARRSTPPPVKAIALDTNYTDIDPKVAGPIAFTFTGTNLPSTIGASNQKRGLFSGLGNAIKGAAGAVTSAAEGVAGAVATAVKGAAGDVASQATSAAADAAHVGGALATQAASAASSVASDAAGALGDANNVSIDKSDTLLPIVFDKTVNLINIQENCGAVKANVKADLEGKANANVTIGVQAGGTIVPPNFSSFSLDTIMDAALNGILTVNGDAAATASSGQITLFTVGIPGLDIPGILTLGPSFNVDASLDATLEVGLNMQVALNYQVKGLNATVPPNKDTPPAGFFAPLDTPLKLAATPEVTGKLSLTAHLIPNLKFGINALDNKANVDAFLNLDASATLTANFDAKPPGITATIGGNGASSSTMMEESSSSTTMMDKATSTMMMDKPASTMMMDKPSTMMMDKPSTMMMDNRRRYMGARSAPSYEIAVARAAALEASELATRDIPITGCVNVAGAFNVNIGANGDLFNIINKNVQDNLFSKSFTIFNKCFNGAIPTRREVAAPVLRRSVPRRSQLVEARAANALTCQPFTTSGAVPSAIADITAAAGDLLKTAK